MSDELHPELDLNLPPLPAKPNRRKNGRTTAPNVGRSNKSFVDASPAPVPNKNGQLHMPPSSKHAVSAELLWRFAENVLFDVSKYYLYICAAAVVATWLGFWTWASQPADGGWKTEVLPEVQNQATPRSAKRN
jgi:hypothetical protein